MIITNEIIYKIKFASQSNIYKHLEECSNSFLPPLSTRVDISSYAEKIAEKGITFEAWHKDILVGLVAAYFNQSINPFCFITNVSVVNDFKGKGIAVRLMEECIDYAKKNSCNEVRLEVDKDNKAAIALYRKFNLTSIETKGNTIVMQIKL